MKLIIIMMMIVNKNRREEFHERNVELRMPDPKEGMLHDSINIEVNRRQNQFIRSRVSEARRVITLGGAYIRGRLLSGWQCSVFHLALAFRCAHNL